jgi:hypothetical protein
MQAVVDAPDLLPPTPMPKGVFHRATELVHSGINVIKTA